MSPKFRESIYYLGTIGTGLVGLLLIWGGIEQGTADSLGEVLTGLLALVGASAPATAAVQTGKQRREGMFDVLPPADQVVNGVQAVIEAQAQATADLERVKEAVTSAVGVVPGMGPLAQQVINSAPVPFR